ncbi:MAG: crossover junction endodeoxyribonuclease RuvC [Polyangiaceae bacterium]
MLVLGIDPGTLHLGWGVVERQGNRLRHVAHGVLHMPQSNSLSQRLLAISSGLAQVIESQQPAVASVESLFFHKDAQSAAKLGHARGVVLLCLQQAGVALAEYAPARVKRTVVGNGRADKKQVAQMVRAMLGLPKAPPSDAADALALAITHLRLGSLISSVSSAEAAPGSPRERLLRLIQGGRRRR